MNITAQNGEKTRDLDAPRTIEPGRLTLITQDIRDRGLIDLLCPHDQVRTFIARREDNKLIFEVQPEAQPDQAEVDLAKLRGMSDAELQTLAAELSVKWDEKASRETMVNRVLKAQAKAK